MKNSEIKELSSSEIEEKIVESNAILTKLKINHTVSPLDNPLKIKAARKEVARLKTELRQRTLK